MATAEKNLESYSYLSHPIIICMKSLGNIWVWFEALFIGFSLHFLSLGGEHDTWSPCFITNGIYLSFCIFCILLESLLCVYLVWVIPSVVWKLPNILSSCLGVGS